MKKGSSFYGGGYNSFYGNIDSYGDINNLYEYKELGPLPIVSFNDAIKNSKIKELIVAATPQQDLHGYANPWPAGGWKNLLDPSKRTSYESGYGQRWYESEGFTLKANQAYTFSVTYGNPIALYIRDKATGDTLVTGNTSITHTPTADTVVFFQAYRGENISSVDTFQLELGSTATSYSSYANVCPITGHTAAKVTRCGKNLLDASSVGTLDSTVYFYEPNGFLFKANTSYTFSVSANGVVDSISIYGTDKTTQLAYANGANIRSVTYTPTQDTYGLPRLYKSTGVTQTIVDGCMLELGSTATAYEPYAGQVYEIKFPLLTKNLADMREENIKLGYYIATNGAETAHSSNFIYNQYIPVKANTSYTISMSSSVYFISISEYSSADRNGFIIRKAGSTGSNTKFTVTTGSSTKYIRFGSNVRGSSGEDLTMQEVLSIDWMLEEGSTASDYEPYTSTVYGGMLDVTSGVLTVTNVCEMKKWSDGLGDVDLGSFIRRGFSLSNACLDNQPTDKSNIAPRQATYNLDSLHFYINGTNTRAYVFLPEETDGNTEIQLLYSLAAPGTYQLTPTEVSTLLGENNVWADTGNVTLTYKAKK